MYSSIEPNHRKKVEYRTMLFSNSNKRRMKDFPLKVLRSTNRPTKKIGRIKTIEIPSA